MVTPVDFHTDDNLLSAWVRKVDVDRMVEVLGNVPGTLLNAAFIALMPLRLTVRKYAGLADIAGDRAALENFLRMERWIHDSPDQAGTAFREFIRGFFQENRLLKGGLQIGGRRGRPAADHLPDPQRLRAAGSSRSARGLARPRGPDRKPRLLGHSSSTAGTSASTSAAARRNSCRATIAQWLRSR